MGRYSLVLGNIFSFTTVKGSVGQSYGALSPSTQPPDYLKDQVDLEASLGLWAHSGLAAIALP